MKNKLNVREQINKKSVYRIKLIFTYIPKSVCKLQVYQYIDLKYIVLLTSHSIKVLDKSFKTLVFTKTSQGLLN